MNSNSFSEQDSLQTRADVLLFINVSKVKVSRIRICSSGDRATVSGTVCRGFESLRVCFFVYVNLFPRTMSHACMEISDFREHRREPEVQEFVGGRE